MVATNGRGLRRQTRGDDVGNPEWSPDGKALVYEHDFHDRQGADKSAVVIRPLHGKRRVLARASFDPNDVAVGSPSWSPDGRWVAYLRWDDYRSRLVLVRPNGTGRRRFPYDADSFAWSPDGRQLALVGEYDVVTVAGVD